MKPHTPPPPSPPPPPPQSVLTAIPSTTHAVHKTLTSVANLANLLPTGTLLTFRTLIPEFSDKGVCQLSNKFLTASVIAFCSVTCFLSSFTDSFTDRHGRLHYGIATFKGIRVLSSENRSVSNNNIEELLLDGEEELKSLDLSKFRVSMLDMIHALVSAVVFLVFAFSDSDVQKCFFPMGGQNLEVLVKNLPVAAGFFSSFLFTVFPTSRRGIGYADVATKLN